MSQLILTLAQSAESYGEEFASYPEYDPSLWERISYITYGWTGWIYFAFMVWMIIYCVKNDPDRYLWLWVIFLLQPLGPFIYFIARWLPSSHLQAPSFTRKWTKGRELRVLETAALQIGNAHQHVQYGDALKNVGKKKEALAAFRKALEKEPENLAALWGAASMEFKVEEHSAAKQKLEKILEKDPAYKFGDVSLMYGKVLGALNEDESARTHLEQHIRKWRQPEAMFLLANLYLANQQQQLASEILQNMVIDIDSSPRAIARKQVFWKSRAKRLLRKIPKSS